MTAIPSWKPDCGWHESVHENGFCPYEWRRNTGSAEEGSHYVGDLYNIQPFGNVLTRLEIKGKDLREIINAQISPVLGLTTA